MKNFTLLCLSLSFGISPLLAQKGLRDQPDAGTILGMVENVYAGINDYTVTLNIAVNIEHLKVPSAIVTMYVKQPDKVHFDATGFAMVPKQAVAFNFARLRERYEAEQTVERDTIDGRTAYRLTLLPKKDKTRLRRVQVYIDAEHWTPDSVRIPSLDGRVMAAGIKNQLVEGRWLPAEVVVTFGVASGDSSVPNVLEEVAPGRRQAPGRVGSATIRYSGYKINTGLRDDLFKEDVEPKGRP